MKSRILGVTLAGLLCCATLIPALPQAHADDNNDITLQAASTEGIPAEGPLRPNSYIVTLKSADNQLQDRQTTATQTQELVRQAESQGIQPFYSYEAMGGYAAELNAEQLTKLRADDRLNVVPDGTIYAPGAEPTLGGPGGGGDIITATNENYQELMAKDDKVTIFYIGAYWCSACILWEPKIEKMNRDDNGSWRMAEIDYDKAKVAGEYFVNKFDQKEIPFMVAYRNNKVIGGKYLPRKSVEEARAWVTQVVTGFAPTPSPTPTKPTVPPTTAPVPPTTKPPVPPTTKPVPPTTAPVPPTTKPPAPNPGAKIRTVNDQNINEAVSEWSKEKLTILSVTDSRSFIFGFYARWTAQQSDGSWILGTIDGRVAKDAAAKALALGGMKKAPALIAIRNGQFVAAYTGEAKIDPMKKWIDGLNGAQPTVEPTKPTVPPTTEPTKPTPSPTKPTTPTVPPTTPPVATTAEWNLDMLDNREAKKDQKFSPNGTGEGVNIYVVDSGITATHDDFAGRNVVDGFSAIEGKSALEDCYRHGTHVSSIAAGNKYGVAKGANLISVRIYDCQGRGTDSGFRAALDWVLKNAKAPAVMNASWGVQDVPKKLIEMDQLVKKIIDAGVTVPVAAGNDGKDACDSTPARLPEAITVGSMDSSLNFYDRHNWGKCVDVVAPGVQIKAAKYNTKDGVLYGSGTSMATPHVSGAVALYLQNHRDAKPAEVHQFIVDNATKNVLASVTHDTPNRLLYVGR